MLAGLDPLGVLAERMQVVPQADTPEPDPANEGLAKAFAEELVNALEQGASFASDLTLDQGQRVTGTFFFTINGAGPDSNAFIDSAHTLFAGRGNQIQTFSLPGVVIINVSDVAIGNDTVNIDLLLSAETLTLTMQ